MKRPFAVAFLGWLFIFVGLAALLYHLIKGTLDFWMVTIVLFELVAVLAGIFLLQGRNWARWLLLAWIAFHVISSGLNSLIASVPHLLLLIAVAYFLFTPPDSQYFGSARAA
ncbi:MAG TPA: hypothetical protein VN087_21355 [Verrucomicrobiae bacterium]|jgi:hypothetical protein|nr:hypothetical protein [Verrucomicrobiae bacterium]